MDWAGCIHQINKLRMNLLPTICGYMRTRIGCKPRHGIVWRRLLINWINAFSGSEKSEGRWAMARVNTGLLFVWPSYISYDRLKHVPGFRVANGKTDTILFEICISYTSVVYLQPSIIQPIMDLQRIRKTVVSRIWFWVDLYKHIGEKLTRLHCVLLVLEIHEMSNIW